MNNIYYQKSDRYAAIPVYSNQNRSLLDRLLVEQARQRLERITDMAEKALEKQRPPCDGRPSHGLTRG